jgi:putative salt-induced outer membrane protein YdiY
MHDSLQRACALTLWAAFASVALPAQATTEPLTEPPTDNPETKGPDIEVIDLSKPVPADSVLPAMVVEAPVIRIDLGASFALSRGAYTTRRLAGDGEVEYRYTLSEVLSEFHFDREYVQEAGATSSVSSDEYDANIKWKTWLTDNPYYVFWSPRARFNRFGFFRSSQALSAGLGRRFQPGSDLSLTLEVGPGIRSARPQTGASVIEGMYTVSGKIDLSLSDALTFRFNLVDERSTRENYRTVTASVRNKITERVWLKYEMAYRKAFPFDSAPSNAESSFDAGLNYRF